MAKKNIKGYWATEAVIGWIIASLLVGFIGGVAYGVYKSGSVVDPHQSDQAAEMQARLTEAIQRLEAQAEKDPENSEVWIQLGHHYFDANLPEKAVDAYEKALAISPKNADIWTDLGVMHRRTGNPRKAVEAFDKAMAIDADHQISRFNKGIVLLHDLDDAQGALKAWESLLALNPDARTPGGQTVRELVDQIAQRSRTSDE